ncbi:hypothetical protein BFS06_12260 [Clostridium perfringens]|uniref:Uncharacterized protein n=1 Tax=Clostridium perfringens TaxID=1502 RepID=A0A140GR19_CLOPF|nr:hypothetical protein [Clostridium perfringens]AMN30978.1 hypothetical protein JFP838_pA0062 [Clostridium perfringens]TBX14974.1 hypothetical protein BFS06_12260 [Clostridium perfringens]
MNKLVKYYGHPGEFVCSFNVKFKRGVVVTESSKTVEEIEKEFNAYIRVNNSLKNIKKNVVTIKIPKKYKINEFKLDAKPCSFFYRFIKTKKEEYDYVVFIDDFLGTKKILIKLSKIIDKFLYEYYEHDILNNSKDCQFPIGLKFCYKGNLVDFLCSKYNQIMNFLISEYFKASKRCKLI